MENIREIRKIIRETLTSELPRLLDEKVEPVKSEYPIKKVEELIKPGHGWRALNEKNTPGDCGKEA